MDSSQNNPKEQVRLVFKSQRPAEFLNNLNLKRDDFNKKIGVIKGVYECFDIIFYNVKYLLNDYYIIVSRSNFKFIPEIKVKYEANPNQTAYTPI